MSTLKSTRSSGKKRKRAPDPESESEYEYEDGSGHCSDSDCGGHHGEHSHSQHSHSHSHSEDDLDDDMDDLLEVMDRKKNKNRKKPHNNHNRHPHHPHRSAVDLDDLEEDPEQGVDQIPIPSEPPSAPSEIKLSPEQEYAVQCVMDGESVFITGASGTGKSVALKAIIQSLQSAGDVVAVTSSTSQGAMQLGARPFTLFQVCEGWTIVWQ